MAIVLVSLMPPEVNSLKHPRVAKFKRIIQSGCKEYGCTLSEFAIQNGTVLISVTDNEFARIIRDGARHFGRHANLVEDERAFYRAAKQSWGPKSLLLKALIGIATRTMASVAQATLHHHARIGTDRITTVET